MKLLKTLFATALITCAGMANALDVVVNITNIENASGEMKIAAYDSKDSMKAYQSAFSHSGKVDDNTYTVTFSDLAPGQYGFMVYQDVNEDDKLNRSAMGIPSEPWGFSNNPRLMGPPQFEMLAVNVVEDGQQIDIKLN